jgi:hypothetical protein
MTRRTLAFLFTFIVGAIVGHVAIPSVGAQAQTHKSMTMTRLFTGPDNQTHAEEVEMKFTAGSPNEVYKMLPVNAAELHRGAAGRVSDWHVARAASMITLSGTGELEVVRKRSRRPNHIELIEDTTGRSHHQVTGTGNG